ncbi:hypothetical protein F3Y22_tig00110236pilonHSYRG00153 [Hibiscus syriacus]|uniref:Lon N-terminal domain-containing protein n=1 Tax=Hibiscus syriacus TaxID=106335 RepID=A0A6A3BD26_HIBSY|nr:hypothetical protein F3Y22_tig00110236pilonHSYRG00153 [Hibiscus syriacus]
MALLQFIPSPSSSLTHKPSINPNANNPSLLNPNSNPFCKPYSFPQSRRLQRLSSLRCSASSFAEKHCADPKSDDVVEIPLFPPLSLFPGSVLPLQIFEFRYRIMMHTLLHTDLRFGVIYSDHESGTASVGCVGEIIKHERLVDDRFFLICKGQERFRVTSIVRTKPYLIAEVNWLEDRPSVDEDLDGLANEVES